MNQITIKRFPALSYAAREAINTLCTNLSFSGENVHRVMVTSCHASEGKSFVSMNIMRTMARLGKNADVRVEVLVKICSVLGCTIDDIMEIIPEEKEQ